MILDSSAVVAAVFGEVGHEELEQKMREADLLAIGAPTLVETGMVLIGEFGEVAHATISRLRERLGIVVIAFGEAHWEVAAEAFGRYGKGRHPAALNYGDCMAYATARLAGQPLLFIGNDFAQTDIEAA
ncbi:MAG TPA: type II toxin-antitoxin system VapC family toxin [Solirubrobacterales bacterium]|nr:type II toxin-antitoxin system VapC family toxin [Solirubrobacterales bacterium]